MKTLVRNTFFAITALFALTACGSAGWDYEAVTSADVNQLVATSPDDDALVSRWVVGSGGKELLLGHPAPCHRKDCAGPETEYYSEIREAALLLSAMAMLDRAAQEAAAAPYSEKARAVTSLLRNRLPELRHRISEARVRLEESGLELAQFESLDIAQRRLERAARLANRLELVVAAMPSGEQSYVEHATADYRTVR